MFGCPSSKQSYFSPSLLERSKATQPLVSLQMAAHSLVVLLPSSSGQIPSCHPAPRHAPFPTNSMSSERKNMNWMGGRYLRAHIHIYIQWSMLIKRAVSGNRRKNLSCKLSETCLLLTYGPVSFTIYLSRVAHPIPKILLFHALLILRQEYVLLMTKIMKTSEDACHTMFIGYLCL